MATLAELSKMRADLHAARMTGAREFCDQNGETVVYKSDSEMARALAALDSEITALTSRPANTILFRTSKGL
jgi:hypothetical protein